jgi:MYXO-CTERM domain-containing protein
MTRGTIAGIAAGFGGWLGIAWAIPATTATAHAAPTEPETLVNPLVETVACENCHLYMNAGVQAQDPPYSPFRTWQGSMMANAARDPVFWAGVAVADADSPGDTELCVRCHAPRAFLEGNGGATSMEELEGPQLQGVECELCHRSMEDPETPAGNAQYLIDDVVVGTNVPRRGPWDFTDGNDEPPHSWIADPYTGSSRLCGTCHDVTTERERVDDDGVGLGMPFNEQRTYAEWLASDYAEPGDGFRSCQDCHMPAVADMPGCTQHVNLQSHPVGGRRHDLVGANRFMVELLRSEFGSSGTNDIADLFFNTTLDNMDAFLPTSATVELTAPAEVDIAEGISALGVRVINNTGHKLPTGYSEGRVMWLEVTAEYAGEIVYSSGLWDQARGIQQDAQVRTYLAEAEDYADGTKFHLLRNNHWVIDNRIPPAGLTPNIETDPVGDRYALQGDGTWPNFDDHSYTFAGAPEIADATPGDTSDDALLVTVRVRYVINTAEYIAFLGRAGGDAGAHVADLFDIAGGATPVTLGEATAMIPIVGFGASADTTGSGTSTTTADPDTTAGTTTSDGTTSATTAPVDTSTGTGEGSTGPGATDDGAQGCGCASGRDAAGGWLGALVVLALRRRRR